jgi:hypothetical protein
VVNGYGNQMSWDKDTYLFNNENMVKIYKRNDNILYALLNKEFLDEIFYLQRSQ